MQIDMQARMWTQTAATDGSINRSAARWSDLPSDLLGVVSLWLASLHDRVRFAAVSRSWRAAALQHPSPPAAPLLLLFPRAGGERKKHICSPENSWVFRVPPKVANKRFLGSHDCGWAIVATDFHELTVVNLFSGVEVTLSPKQSSIFSCARRYPWAPWNEPENIIEKIIFSQDPTSSNGCILASINEDRSQILLCRVGCLKGGWSTYHWRGERISDIAFCNGELCALTDPSEVLITFEIDMREDGPPLIKGTRQLAIRRPPSSDHHPSAETTYLLELHGKPAMAIMTSWLPNRDPFFKVFKLAETSTDKIYEYKWEEVTKFDDYALFLGRQCSKAVHVPVGAGRNSVQRNHIYYPTMYRPWHEEYKPSGGEVYSVISDFNDGKYNDMYCKVDQSIGDGVERIGYYVSPRCDHMWLLPPDL